MISEIVLNKIGQALMSNRDNTPLGENREWDFIATHKSLKNFNLAWLKEGIDNISKQHEKPLDYKLKEYFKALNKLEKKDKYRNTLWRFYPYNCVELYIGTTPAIHIVVKGKRDHRPSIRIYDNYINLIHKSDAGLSPSELVAIFTDFDIKLKKRTLNIIKSGLKELVPTPLKYFFLRGKITQDMGHSMYSDGWYSIGREIRLKGTKTHDMVYAYIADYLNDEKDRKCLKDNVEYSYWALKGISSYLPKNVEFICQDRDDCGVELINEKSTTDEDEYFRQKAVNLAHRYMDNDIKLSDYEDIMGFCHLKDKYTLEEFVDMCQKDYVSFKDIEQNIINRLGPYAEEVTIDYFDDSIDIYLMKDRHHRWGRECLLRFPYETDLSFLDNIGFFFDKANELNHLFQDSRDYNTTVGLVVHP